MFEPISELLPVATERILDRVANPAPPIPDDEAGQVKWVNDNL